MLNKKSEIILKLLCHGRAVDVLELMEGESRYTTEASEGAPTDNVQGRLWVGALYHLRFVAVFGGDGVTQEKDGKVMSPFPEIFNEWLEVGAPGIGLADLESYLYDHPL